jgi:DNA-binding SARP family transcriptional activator
MAVGVRSGPSTRPAPETTRSVSPARVCLLGGFEVRLSGWSVPIPASAERLLALLALFAQPLHRHYVSGMLWPDTPDERAAANLRSTLWRIRRAGFPLVEVSNRRLALGSEVSIDIQDWIVLVTRSRDPAFEIGDVDVAMLSAPTELLPGWDEEWVVIERERFRQLRLHGLEACCERLSEQKRFGAAVEAGLAALREEPLRESGQTALIRTYLAEGNVSEALRQFEHYRALLRSELGLEPSIELERLLDPRRSA